MGEFAICQGSNDKSFGMKQRIKAAVKIIMAVCIAATVALSSAGCVKDRRALYNENSEARRYAQICSELGELVRKDFYHADAEYASHYVPEKPDDASIAFLWPYMELIAQVYREKTLYSDKDYLSDVYAKLIDELEYYKRLGGDGLAYCATRAADKGWATGDCYYDDNVWIAREFLNAYMLTESADYLDKAERVTAFVWSGWDDKLGGIFWQENKKTSRNTCSNAPFALLAARLYEITANREYLDQAIAVYEWTRDTLRDQDGVYWDNIAIVGRFPEREDGEIDTRKYAYNTGSMIAAAVKLYEITKDETFLTDAVFSAQGGAAYFMTGNPPKRMPDIPWFNLLLLDGFVELCPYYEGAHDMVKDFADTLVYAYEHNRDKQGYVAPDWVGGWSEAYKYRNVLDHAATAEAFGLLSYYYQFIK